MHRPKLEIADIFRAHGPAWRQANAGHVNLSQLKVMSAIEACLIGMEACSSAHHWARELTALGHEVRLIPPMNVKPYVEHGKSDAINAAAICEAVTRPTMRFVASICDGRQFRNGREFAVSC